MSVNSKIAALSNLIKKNRQVLKRIERYYHSFIETEMVQGDKKISAAIAAVGYGSGWPSYHTTRRLSERPQDLH